jgi:hypothetical protein
VLLPGSDVRPGSRIAISTSERLSDGMQVQVIPESSAPIAAVPSHPEAK